MRDDGGFRITIITGDARRSRRIGNLLGLCGWMVHRAARCAGAIGDAMLILLDADTPTYPVLSTIGEIQQVRPDLPVMILAMAPNRSERARWIEWGADDVLTDDL